MYSGEVFMEVCSSLYADVTRAYVSLYSEEYYATAQDQSVAAIRITSS